VEGTRVTALTVTKGSILRTAAGKPSGRALWKAFVEGLLLGDA
jgi:hypothetical protein